MTGHINATATLDKALRAAGLSLDDGILHSIQFDIDADGDETVASVMIDGVGVWVGSPVFHTPPAAPAGTEGKADDQH
jgi:hypothetical protein